MNSSLLFHSYNMPVWWVDYFHTKQLISERLSDSAAVPEAWWQDEDVRPGLLASGLVCPCSLGQTGVWSGQGDSQTWVRRRGRGSGDAAWGPRTSLRCWAADALPRHLLLLPFPGKTSQGTLATHGCICVPQVQGCLLLPAMGDSGRRWLGNKGRSSAGMSAGNARSPELTDIFPPHSDTHTHGVGRLVPQIRGNGPVNYLGLTLRKLFP